MTKPSNTYFADSTLSLSGKTGEAVRWEQEQETGTISESQKHLDIGGYKEDSFVHIVAF